jgi:hypothetical protein
MTHNRSAIKAAGTGLVSVCASPAPFQDNEEGKVDTSSCRRKTIACSRVAPHISDDGCKFEQTAGRVWWPNSLQPDSSSSWLQRMPAGLPFGIPGIGEEIDGAIQQAPQPVRHSTRWVRDLMQPYFSRNLAGFAKRRPIEKIR